MNGINRGDNAPRGQLEPSLNHCELVHKIVYLHRVTSLAEYGTHG